MTDQLDTALAKLGSNRADADALRSVLVELRPLALGYAARLLDGRVDEAEDVVQEVLLKVVAEIAEGRPLLRAAGLRRYTIRCVINECIDTLRAEVRAYRRHQSWTESQPDLGTDSHEDARITELWRAVGRLRHPDQRIASLYLRGSKMKEIARVTGVSYGAVTVRMHRIRQELAKALRDNKLPMGE